MLAIPLGPDHVAKYLERREDDVQLAAINSQANVTLSGEVSVIGDISAAMEADRIFHRILNTGDNAYHSHHMITVGRDYVEKLTEGIKHIQRLELVDAKQRYQHAPWVSSVTPSKSTADFSHSTSYWRANLESPVRFSEAVTNLLEMKDVSIHALVEIGPHPALKSPLKQILNASPKTLAYASTLKREEDGRKSMLQLAGTLFSLNANLDLAAVNAVDEIDGTGMEHGCTSINLPPYQYTYDGLNYHESRASREYRFRSVLRHDLLGSKVAGNAKLRPVWRNIFRAKDVPWLGDHRLVPGECPPPLGQTSGRLRLTYVQINRCGAAWCRIHCDGH